MALESDLEAGTPHEGPMSDTVSRLNAALDGRYRIESELGEGGMATVYLADDLKHERKVAVKVLKPELAAVVGAERFLAEIKTTANLTHPNILPLHDSGEAEGFLFYVMPYVEGETLRDRLDRERQLPVDDAARIASDVADALEYAHGHGVIHRDIKPANILLQSGRPLIADFGIALAVSASGSQRLTETGLSLGTPHYMSPEQATGDQSVGPATDIYAVGCVLYEMLIGEPPFTGSTPQAILGKIITGDVKSVTAQRRSVPANVNGAVKRSLEGVPADRFASAQDFAGALSDVGFRHRASAEESTVAAERRDHPPLRRALHWVVTVSLAATVLTLALSQDDQPALRSISFAVAIPQNADNTIRPSRNNWTLSPAGDLLVYKATPERDSSALYLRRMDQEGATPIAGTEGAVNPFFSPDGEWVGFFVGPGSLRRVSLVDGTIETIVQDPETTEGVRGATWGDDGTIVYGGAVGLYRVDAPGGEPTLVATHPDAESGSFVLNDLVDRYPRYYQPHMLPGSRSLVFHVLRSGDASTAELVALDLVSGERKTLLPDATDPRYVSTGHLLFMRRGTLMGVRFDVERLQIEGDPVAMVEDVMHSLFRGNTRLETGAAQLAVSSAGHLVYVRGGVSPLARSVPVVVTVDGEMTPLNDLSPGPYGYFRMSPDGSRLAFLRGPGLFPDIRVLELTTGAEQILVSGAKWFVWKPDGEWLAFQRDGTMYQIRADGSGGPIPRGGPGLPASWSSGGDLAFLRDGDMWILPPDGAPEPFLESGADVRDAAFSPDGKWLAYSLFSDRQGSTIYVRQYPGPGGAIPISSRNSHNPSWSPDGRKLYYLDYPEGRPIVMAVDFTAEDRFLAGRPEVLMDWPSGGRMPNRGYDVFSDGSFLTQVRPERLGLDDPEASVFVATEYHVILNFFEELKARVPN
jgi:eukaryotic-like serine/threonine-protein kinase